MLTKNIFLCLILCAFCASSKGESRLLNSNEKQHLLGTLKNNTPPFSCDISCEIVKICPREPIEQQFQALKERAEKIKGTRLMFHYPGFFQGENYIIFCQERIVIENRSNIRTEITCFSDFNKTDITLNKINIYNNGAFHSIDKRNKLIEVSDQPVLESIGIGFFEFLSFGNTAGYLNYSAVSSLLLNDSNDGIQSYKPQFYYDGRERIDDLSSDVITRRDKNIRKELTLFLDPNDWDRCNKIIQYNRNGNESSRIEFADFIHINGAKNLYPFKAVITRYDEQGKEKEQVIINVSKVTMNPSITQNLYDINDLEFKGYTFIRPKL